MAKPSTRSEFKKYCLRRLGWPVIDINVDEDQVEDRIDDSLQFFQDYHFDGCEKLYMKHKITAEDIQRKWIYCPEPVIFVTGVMPFTSSDFSSMNMFDYNYQFYLSYLHDFASISYVGYEIARQHIRTLELIFAGTPQFRFNRHMNKLYLDINWSGDVKEDRYIVIECYRALSPDAVTLTGTLTSDGSSTTVTGYSTKFDQEVLEGDIITLQSGEEVQIDKINSATEIVLLNPTSSPIDNVSFTKAGTSDVWNDRFLKQYATAKIKYQWGSNLSKFAGVQLPGGVTLDGPRIMQEALEEINKIEDEMQSYNVLPNEMFIG